MGYADRIARNGSRPKASLNGIRSSGCLRSRGVWGEGDLKVAMSLGKIIREHGLDVSVGKTVVAECADAKDAACIALKRSGKSLDAGIDIAAVECDINCLLILAGGVHRMLPAGAKVFVGPTQVRNRFAPNVSDEQQKGLQA